MTNDTKEKGLQTIAEPGHTFAGMIIGTGPKQETKTVKMYITVARHSEEHGAIVISDDCATLGALEEQVNKLKKDLDWVHANIQGIRQKQRGKTT